MYTNADISLTFCFVFNIIKLHTFFELCYLLLCRTVFLWSAALELYKNDLFS